MRLDIKPKCIFIIFLYQIKKIQIKKNSRHNKNNPPPKIKNFEPSSVLEAITFHPALTFFTTPSPKTYPRLLLETKNMKI